VVFVDISNRNTNIYKIFDFIRPVDEWAEIAFSACQNAENEHCETLKKLVHRLNFSSLDMLIQDFRRVIRVILLDQSEFSMRGILCLSKWTNRSTKLLFS